MKTFAIKARKKLIDEILDRIQMFSLDSKTELPNLLPKNPVKQECFLQLQRQIEENDVLSVAEQAACVWFHRLVSIWFMEVNEYLPTEPFFSRFSPNGFKRNDVDADTLEEKEEMQYWNCLGLDDKGKKIVSREIDASNYAEIIFNNYEGNAIKNMVQQAIANMQTNSDQ